MDTSKKVKKTCPKCQSTQIVKSGIINNKQRFKCKDCQYYFTVDKIGKQVDNYYIIKALQLYVEGVSYREIERLLGISHVSVMKWVKKFQLTRPVKTVYKPSYKIFKHQELIDFYAQEENLKGAGMIVTELGDKYMLIKWDRFK
ncbi:IS1/IS1595 family N-terminal zinc-binding domain-containing protein [Pedobacter glucosidilyticus]|uniref:IS1/IS1595 family N-terminal zinc-binding domain-containing protein n=1 Tax=Pedobacter glucosidilyticus TaxID=1122941 RepID=UPI00040B3C10|nr:IS1 family transposase [Pedobacter glucosidilyticus]